MNSIGSQFADLPGVTAMTDVTGFGLLGHLAEICEGSGVNARVHFDQVQTLDGVPEYIAAGCVPGGTNRNFESYGHKIGPLSDYQKAVLCDPQTSGGLLVAIKPEAEQALLAIAEKAGIAIYPVGELIAPRDGVVVEVVYNAPSIFRVFAKNKPKPLILLIFV